MSFDLRRQTDDEASDVVARMVALRRELASDVEQVGESARAMTDWTSYVRRFPWATVGLAAAAGFMLVPRKSTTVTPTAEQVAALANNREFVAAATQHLKSSDGLLKQLATPLAAIAGKALFSYLTSQFRAGLAAKQNVDRAPEEADDSLHDQV